MDPYKVRPFLGQFSETHLREALQAFLDIDEKLKGWERREARDAARSPDSASLQPPTADTRPHRFLQHRPRAANGPCRMFERLA